MRYRRDPRRRRYSSSAAQNTEHTHDTDNSMLENTSKEVKKIPLPNEKDEPAFSEKTARTKRSFLSNIFSRQLHTDEIILLGLIFLLIEERIDDDFLLIVLIYLLISEILEEQFRPSEASS